MAHFALLNDNNVVVQVCVVDNVNASGEFPDSEISGVQYLLDCGFSGVWLQTSYNHNFRKQYAGIGFTYDPIADVFVAPQPFPSWTLDANHDWQPPTPKPKHGIWLWDESTLSWQQITPPEGDTP